MIKRYQNKANIGIGVGILLSVGVVIASYTIAENPGSQGELIALLLLGLNLLARVVFIYGCVMYAKAKARNGWWGAFGLLSLIGLIVLVLLKDHAKDDYEAGPRGFSPIMPSETPPTLPPRM